LKHICKLAFHFPNSMTPISGSLKGLWQLDILIFMLSLSLPVSAFAVDAHGNGVPACPLSGAMANATVVVTDPTGALVPQAAVEIRCKTTATAVQTNDAGSALFHLRPGSYQIAVIAPGFGESEQTVSLGESKNPLTIVIAPGAATDTINVTADSGFVPFASNAGSKTNAQLIEVPQSISVVNEREMRDRNVRTVNEALRYTPGITPDEYGIDQRFDWLKIRGFDAQTFGVFRDGTRFNSLSGKLDPFELESVEILKGPSSVLYGEAPPGGLVNQVTKRPPAERQYVGGAEFGSYDRRQGTVDVGGPIEQRGIFRYRLLGLIRDSGTQVNFTPDNRRLIAPSFAWQPDERTNVTGLADYQHDGTKWGQSLPAKGTLYDNNPNGPISESFFAGEPSAEGVTRDQASVAYTADHLFKDRWDAHQSYRFQHINVHASTLYATGYAAGSDSLLTRGSFSAPERDDINTLDTRVLRRFSTTNWSQTVLAGYDYLRFDTSLIDNFGASTDINVLNPVYGKTGFPAGVNYTNNHGVLNQNGVYLQDQVKYREHLVFTIGGREDWAVNDVTNFVASEANTHQDDSKFTGRAGVTYLTNFGLAPYFSYATSFLPTVGTDIFGTAFKPTTGSQEEAGIKFQPHTWTSFFTVAYYNLLENNVEESVQLATGEFDTLQQGQARSRGFEFEGLVNLQQGWNIHTSYSLDATASTKSRDAASLGKWLPQVARNTASTLLDYQVQSGRVAGLGLEGGVRFAGRNAADLENTFFIRNYTLVDAGVRYSYRHMQLQVNATNLANRRYVSTCISASSCYFGYASNVVGDVRYHF
jgi:iron complex outermembrane receptor protein